MTTLQEQLQSTVNQAQIDADILHDIIHGATNAEVETENGTVKTIAKVLSDNQNTLNQSINTITEMRDLTLLAADEAINAAEQAQYLAQGHAHNISVTPTGNISSTNAQSALEELDNTLQTLNSTKANASDLGTASTRNVGTVAGDIPILNSNALLDNSLLPIASVLLPGIVQKSSDSEVIAGTENTKFITPKQFAENQNCGVGGNLQTWQDVTSSRSLNTNYTNSTGAPIFVVYNGNQKDGNSAYFYINESVVCYFSASYSFDTTLFFMIIPNGATYKVSDVAGCRSWWELR